MWYSGGEKLSVAVTELEGRTIIALCETWENVKVDTLHSGPSAQLVLFEDSRPFSVVKSSKQRTVEGQRTVEAVKCLG